MNQRNRSCNNPQLLAVLTLFRTSQEGTTSGIQKKSKRRLLQDSNLRVNFTLVFETNTLCGCEAQCHEPLGQTA